LRGPPAAGVDIASTEDFSSCYGLAEECGARGFVLKAQLAGCDLDRFWRPSSG
jgi:H2-forming N5,N10-methylenetetrahydromethanopterin dehydrogenase-like enzyme